MTMASNQLTLVSHEGWSNDYYARLCRLLIDCGLQALKTVFDKIHPPDRLHMILASPQVHEKLKILYEREILDFEQWDKLYPAIPSMVSSESFDLVLLLLLLRSICEINPPVTGWDSFPKKEDISTPADIARVKYFLHHLVDSSQTSLDYTAFSKYWQEIYDILMRLGLQSYGTVIKDLKNSSLDHDMEEYYQELMEQLASNEENIKGKLMQLEIERGNLTKDIQSEGACGCSWLIEEICQLYINRGRLSPFPWCQEFVFHIDDVSTRRRVLNRMQGKGTATEEIFNTFDIFRPHEKCQNPKRVFIEGAPGLGKTTLCQKVAYDWAKRRQEADRHFLKFDVVFLLTCRNIESGLWESIDDQLLPWDIEKEERNQFFKFVRDNQSKVLLVLDGLDELPPHSTSFLSDVMQGRELPECYLLTTQRDDGMGVRKYCDTCTLLELEGFLDNDDRDFIFNCFGIKPFHLLSCENPLEDLMSNPLDTILACLLLEKSPGICPESRTQLFKETVLSTLRRYGRKAGLSTNNKDLIEIYKAKLELLGSWALNALLENRICFKEDELSGQKRDLPDFSWLFLLSLQSKTGPRYSFFHKSFQEFLAAWYLSLQVVHGEVDPEVLLADTRYFRDLNQVLSFMTGLVAEKEEEIAKSLIKMIANQVNQLKPDSPLNCGSYVRVALQCIRECERKTRKTLAHILGLQLTIDEMALEGINVVVSSLGEVPCSLDEVSASFKKVDRSEQRIDSDFGRVRVSSPSCFKVITGVFSSLVDLLTVNTSLKRLNLSGNNIGDPGATLLAQFLQTNLTLENVGLSRIQMGDAGASALAKALAVNTSLTRLDLSNNNIGDLGAISLGKALVTNSTLAKLNLSWIQMGDAGVTSLAEALTVNTSLTWLDLSGSNIGEPGAISLAEALKGNTALTHLYMGHIEKSE